VSLSREELRRAVGEASSAVQGGRVDRVYDLGDFKVALEVYGAGTRRHVLFSAKPGFSRLHLISVRPPAARTPDAFVMLLRKELGGGRVEALRLFGDDRVARLDVVLGGLRRSLLAELIGRHANLFALDEGDRILGSLRANLSHRRELWPGQPYVYPLPRPAEVGPVRLGTEHPGREAEALYDRLEREARIAEIEREVGRALRGERRRLERRREAIAADLARAQGADELCRMGELLVANLQSVRRGERVARVTDWAADPPAPVEVPLDPALGPRENAERLFQRYRKYRDARRTIEAQRSRAEKDLAALSRWESRAASASGDLDALEALRSELVQRALLKEAPPGVSARRARPEEVQALPYRRFVSREGKPILLGKGAEDNDALTFRVARGNDLWMHARDYPGSHVVVPLGRGEEPTQETLLDAATLAAHHSQAKGAAVVDIAYTRRKFVHKPKDAPPGRVALSESKNLAVRMEPERLERLMRKRGLEEG
jgi:predicted ribosome quality control (RQC) complex YloA/Tae2 family protein